jgi:hypothetical protein
LGWSCAPHEIGFEAFEGLGNFAFECGSVGGRSNWLDVRVAHEGFKVDIAIDLYSLAAMVPVDIRPALKNDKVAEMIFGYDRLFDLGKVY